MYEFVSTVILGLPLVAWGGLVVFTLLLGQILVGKRIIKVDFKYHTYIAWLLLTAAVIHGLAAFIYITGK